MRGYQGWTPAVSVAGPLPSVVASTSQALSRGGFSAVQSASDRVDSLRVPGAAPTVGKRGGLGLLLLAQLTEAVALLRGAGLLADLAAPADGGL